jgi:tellurite resistance protein
MLTTFELMQFAMYLCASDGEIQPEEASHIAEIFGFPLSAAAIGKIIRESNIYSTEFESKVPVSMKIFVAIDNAIHETGQDGVLGKPASETLFEVFRVVGGCIAQADGVVKKQEEKDGETYLRMLNNYMDENLIVRKEQAKGFTKTGEDITPDRMMDIMDKMNE